MGYWYHYNEWLVWLLPLGKGFIIQAEDRDVVCKQSIEKGSVLHDQMSLHYLYT